MAGALTRETRKSGEQLVRQIAEQIAEDRPELEDLTPEQLKAVARVVVAESLKDDLRRRADLAGIDYAGERERFLALAERRSRHTARAYRRALDQHDAWASRHRIAPLELTPALADDWIASMAAGGRSPATVGLRVAGASAFWTWLERRHERLRNPFRGTRARPRKKVSRTLAVPSREEIETICAAAGPKLRAAVVMMFAMGLRVGALPGLSIRGGRCSTTSKGKEVVGEVPPEVLRELARAGVPLRRPFAELSAAALAERFRYLVGKLHGERKLAAAYSVHDLRHAFAVRLYMETNDIYRVSTALRHASVGVTETYLRSLGLRE